ncbi:MAG: hypothetical protein CMH78_00870 [Nitrospinae bacterium]|nr:hypothetical protein [Nitrospinota bacterium]
MPGRKPYLVATHWPLYEIIAEYPAIYGGDECRARARGMQSLSFPLIPRFLRQAYLLYNKLTEKGVIFH